MDIVVVNNKIKEYEDIIQKAKMTVVRAETQVTALEEEQQVNRDRLKSLGITEEELPTELSRLEKEIEVSIADLDLWVEKLKAVLG